MRIEKESPVQKISRHNLIPSIQQIKNTSPISIQNQVPIINTHDILTMLKVQGKYFHTNPYSSYLLQMINTRD